MQEGAAGSGGASNKYTDANEGLGGLKCLKVVWRRVWAEQVGSLQWWGAPFAGEADRELQELRLSRVPKNTLGRDICPRLKLCPVLKAPRSTEASLSRSKLKQMQARGMWLALRFWTPIPPLTSVPERRSRLRFFWVSSHSPVPCPHGELSRQSGGGGRLEI